MALRITPRTAQRLATTALDANLSRMSKLQEHLASGRVLNRPSDSPTGAVSAMQYRSDVRRTEQFKRNADDALNWLGIADDTLTSMLSVIGRARELVIQGLNGSTDAAQRKNIASEMRTLKETLIGFANTKYLDRPVFAGNAQVTAAIDLSTGDYVGGGTTAAPDLIERRVAPDMKVRVNVTGPEVFGPNGSNLFQTVEAIADALDANDTAGLSAVLGQLDARSLEVQNQLGAVGARYHQVQGMRERAEQTEITLKNGLAEIESTDLPKTIVDLQLQEIAYKSALSATARVIQPSLLDFLR